MSQLVSSLSVGFKLRHNKVVTTRSSLSEAIILMSIVHQFPKAK